MFQLHAISPGNEAVEIFTEKAVQIYESVDFIHLREREWSVQQFLSVIDVIKQHDETLAKLIINDRVDIAHVCEITRVHLPSHGLEPAQIQKYFPAVKFGCSVHSVERAKIKEQEGADYLFYGHVYPTNSKKGLQARGLEKLAQVVKSVSIPVIAIGGITLDRMKDVQETGAKGIATMSGIFSSKDYQNMAQQYRSQINNLLGG